MWVEVLRKIKVCLCLLHLAPQSFSISLLAQQLSTVCVFDILMHTQKEQVLHINATILFSPCC